MATLRDLYEITSKANTRGIDQAEKAIEGNTSAIGKLGEKAGGVVEGIGQIGLAMEGLKSIGEAVGGLFEKLAETSPEFATAFEGLQGAIGQVQGALLTPIADALTPVLEKVVEFLSNPAFTKFIDEIGTQLGEVFAIIGDILVTDLLPVLMDLIQGILPPLLEAAAAILKPLGELLRAILPPLVSFITRLAETFGAVLEAIIPVVIEIAEALIPPLLQAIDEILPELLPLIILLAELFGDVLIQLAPLIAEGLAILLPILVDLITWVLPPLIEIITWLADTIGNVLGEVIRWIVGFIQNDLGPIFVWLNENVLTPLVEGFNFWIDAIKIVIDWLKELWDGLGGLEDAIPDWLKPGSPPPLAVGLMDIADALSSIDLGGTFGIEGGGGAAAGAPIGAGGASPVVVNVYGPFGPDYTPEQAGAGVATGYLDAMRERGHRI